MNEIGPKVILNDDVLNEANFIRIEEFMVEQGQEVIWSSLYGHGLRFDTDDVSIIYSAMHFVHSNPVEVYRAQPEGFAEARFFFIDLYPEEMAEQSRARCDSYTTFEIKSPGGALHIQDLTLWYKKIKLSEEEVAENARHAFNALLALTV